MDKDDKLVFLNSMVEYEVLIRSASDPPFGICNVFVYKQLRWAWSKIIKGFKDYQFVTSAKFEAHGYYLSTVINDLSIFSIEILLPVLNTPENPYTHSSTILWDSHVNIPTTSLQKLKF